MATYYVDATAGSDAAAGTSTDAPWQTIAKVNAEAFLPGDSVLFRRGETWTGVELLMPSSGVAGNPITFGAYGTGAKPILDANSTANYAINAVSKTYLALDSLDLRNGVIGCAQFDTCQGVNVLDCDMDGAGNDVLLFIRSVGDIRVIGGTYSGAAAGGGHNGIELTDGGSGFWIEGVTCYSNENGLSIHNHVGTSMPESVTVRNSIARNNISIGFSVQEDNPHGDLDILFEDCISHSNGTHNFNVQYANGYASDITFRRCISYGSASSYTYRIEGDGILLDRCVSFDDNVANCKGVYILNAIGVSIYNCTFHRYTVNFFLFEVDGARSDNIIMKNCVLGHEAGGSLAQVTAAAVGGGGTFTFDYNLYQCNPVLSKFKWNGAWCAWAAWKAASGQDANSPAPADPLFQDVANDLFYLRHGSPALNVGTPIAGMPFYGSKPDCGRWEMRWPSVRLSELLTPAWTYR